MFLAKSGSNNSGLNNNNNPPVNLNSSNNLSRSFSKAGLIFGSGIPAYKQLKQAILDGNEEKAIQIYTGKDNGRSLLNDLDPSIPFPSKKTNNDETPIQLAAKHGMNNLFNLFLEYQGNPAAVNLKNENSLHAACLAQSNPLKRAEIIEMIVNWRGKNVDNSTFKVPIDYQDLEGNTGLHIASFNGLIACVEKLVKHGASLTIYNSADLSSCDEADRGGHHVLGTMIELAGVFKPIDQSIQASDNYHKFSNDGQSARIFLDTGSLTLKGLLDFIDQAIKFTSESLGENSPRAEVLLTYAGWDCTRLKREYLLYPDKLLNAVKLQPKSSLMPNSRSGNHSFVGIPVEEVYLDNAYKLNTPFIIIKDGKKFSYSIRTINGKTGVFPTDYDPGKALSPEISETSHISPKATESCQICNEMMHEPASVSNFLTGKLVDPAHREVQCSSGHKFCFSCWSDHLQARVIRENNGVGCLPCIGYQCGEILDWQWAPVMLVKQDLVNKVHAQRQKQVIESINLKWCPVPNCGLLVHITSSHYRADGSHAIPLSVVCANSHSFCLNCSKEAHSPCSCSDLLSWQEEVREETKNVDPKDPNNIANVLKSFPTSKNCPSCTNVVIKEEGCNHLRCAKCRHEFCWICNREWAFHAGNQAGYFQCNRFIEKPNESGLQKRASRTVHFIHHYIRFQAHGESSKLESKRHREAVARIVAGLKASKDGQMKWLQGNEVKNPYKDKRESDDEFNNRQDLNIKDTVISEFYLPQEESVAFLNEAFKELEKCRSFLRWSYPFALFEFDENFQSKSNLLKNKNPRLTKEQVDEFHLPFDLKQAELEIRTEALSDIIGRKRIRGSMNQISLAARDAKLKRIDLESLILSYYAVDGDESENSSTFAPDINKRKNRREVDEVQDYNIDAVLSKLSSNSNSARVNDERVSRPYNPKTAYDGTTIRIPQNRDEDWEDAEEDVSPYVASPMSNSRKVRDILSVSSDSAQPNLQFNLINQMMMNPAFNVHRTLSPEEANVQYFKASGLPIPDMSALRNELPTNSPNHRQYPYDDIYGIDSPNQYVQDNQFEDHQPSEYDQGYNETSFNEQKFQQRQPRRMEDLDKGYYASRNNNGLSNQYQNNNPTNAYGSHNGDENHYPSSQYPQDEYLDHQDNQYDPNNYPEGQDTTIYHRNRVRREIGPNNGEHYYGEDKASHYNYSNDRQPMNGNYSRNDQYDPDEYPIQQPYDYDPNYPYQQHDNNWDGNDYNGTQSGGFRGPPSGSYHGNNSGHYHGNNSGNFGPPTTVVYQTINNYNESDQNIIRQLMERGVAMEEALRMFIQNYPEREQAHQQRQRLHQYDGYGDEYGNEPQQQQYYDEYNEPPVRNNRGYSDAQTNDYTVEQRVIAPKKNPDQEALEHAILISLQEKEYGINMYDFITDDDEPLIDDYVASGYTREEAILIIFEKCKGKVTGQPNDVTPALPTLHKAMAPPQPIVVAVEEGRIELTEEDEPEIEFLMTKGYTREQAVEFFLQRKEKELKTLHEERQSMDMVRAAAAENEYRPAPFPTQYNNRPIFRAGSEFVNPLSVQSSASSIGPFFSPNSGAFMNDSSGYPNPGSNSMMMGDFSEADQHHIDQFIARGYTQEQAERFFLQNRTALRARQSVSSYSSQPPMMGIHGGSVTGSVMAPRNSSYMSPMPQGQGPPPKAVMTPFEMEQMEEDLLRQGYTQEQATQIISERQLIMMTEYQNYQSNMQFFHHQPVVNNIPSYSSASVNGEFENSEWQLEEDLLRQGYSREQIIQIINERRVLKYQHSSYNQSQEYHLPLPPPPLQPRLSASSVVMNSFELDEEMEIERIMAQGYTREQAIINIREARVRKTSRDVVTRQGTILHPTALEHHRTRHLQSTSSFSSTMTSSRHGHGARRTQTAITSTVKKTADEEALEFGLLLSQQENEYGINMYDFLTPADEPEINRLAGLGYTTDEAILIIFERHYPPLPPIRLPPDNTTTNNNNNNNSVQNNRPISVSRPGAVHVPGSNSGYNSNHNNSSSQHSIPIYHSNSNDSGSPPSYNHNNNNSRSSRSNVPPPRTIHPSTNAHRPIRNNNASRKRSSFFRSSGVLARHFNHAQHDHYESNGVAEDDDVLERAILLSTMDQQSTQGSIPTAQQVSMSNRNNNDMNGNQRRERFKYRQEDVQNLMSMGFTRDQAVDALFRNDNNMQKAANHLLGHG
eukprot:gene5568-7691_t